MDLNLLPDKEAHGGPAGPVIGTTLEGIRAPEWGARLSAAPGEGFAGIEMPLTGEPNAVHGPEVGNDVRDALKQLLTPFSQVAALAPTQASWDVTLVSPSSAIRRASVSEIWAVCRMLGNVTRRGSGVVVVRTGVPPVGVGIDREARYLSECLTTLDRMAGDHGVRIALLNHDYFRSLDRFADLTTLKLSHTGIALDVAGAHDAGASDADLADFARTWSSALLHVRVTLPSAPAPVAPWKHLAEALGQGGFTGMLCLAPPSLRALPAPEMQSGVRAWWEQALGRSGPAALDE